MKKALISTIEPREHFDSSKGYRVAQVVNIGEEFPVAEGLYWMDCDDVVIQDQFYFDTTTNTILLVPVEPAMVKVVQPQPTTSGTTTI